MPEVAITFNKLKIPAQYGKPIFDVYYVIERGRSQVMEKFHYLDDTVKDQIKALISKMCTVKGFKSDNIIYHLKGYQFGELRPLPHRFFFFQRCGNNYIFFYYHLKRKDSLNDKFYRGLNRKKERYGKEFEKYIQRNE